MPPEETIRVRALEQRAACDAVGASALEYLDHPDGTIHDVLRLRRDIAAAVRGHRPDVVLTATPRDFFPGAYARPMSLREPPQVLGWSAARVG